MTRHPASGYFFLSPPGALAPAAGAFAPAAGALAPAAVAPPAAGAAAAPGAGRCSPAAPPPECLRDGEAEGFVKVHVRAGTDRILGATIVARHAGEMLPELTLAIATGTGLGRIASGLAWRALLPWNKSPRPPAVLRRH